MSKKTLHFDLVLINPDFKFYIQLLSSRILQAVVSGTWTWKVKAIKSVTNCCSVLHLPKQNIISMTCTYYHPCEAEDKHFVPIKTNCVKSVCWQLQLGSQKLWDVFAATGSQLPSLPRTTKHLYAHNSHYIFILFEPLQMNSAQWLIQGRSEEEEVGWCLCTSRLFLDTWGLEWGQFYCT